MDWGYVVTFFAGLALGISTEVVRHYLDGKASKTARLQERRQKELDEAYAPALQHLDRLMERFPDCEEAQENLLKLIDERSSLLDLSDLEALRLALTPTCELEDLVHVRQQLDLGTRRRRQMLYVGE